MDTSDACMCLCGLRVNTVFGKLLRIASAMVDWAECCTIDTPIAAEFKFDLFTRMHPFGAGMACRLANGKSVALFESRSIDHRVPKSFAAIEFLVF